MPREFLKSVFSGLDNDVVVISVLGPQSSGKSTLLNFLFGCDFSTSAGRCTKGIYGTYLKLSNFNSCGGILLLDTEGLFGFLNKNEEDKRENFENKLVLFCLAMSDYLLVNFRGDIDKKLSEILMQTLANTLKKLRDTRPELYLILNQNSETKKEVHAQDIDKMTEFGFSPENVLPLPLAFDIKKRIFRAFPDPVVEKRPLNDFSEICIQLQQKIFKSIESSKKRFKPLCQILDKMSSLWDTITNYPDLVRHSTIKDQQLESSMKDWILQTIEKQMRPKVEDAIIQMQKKPNLDFEREFIQEFQTIEKQAKIEFSTRFQKECTENQKLYEEIEHIMSAQMRQLLVYGTTEIQTLVKKNQIRISDMKGEESIYDAIRFVKANSCQFLSEE